ncbi:threonylcarbamoyl-AMP synthase [Aquihabitans sp. G128]|uniref:L-threonylcarbamoyladenylate synthase n=1 Tax=Aquihabitans sp. G128 TaxID=2849779 RepID=UPI001C245147|nr:L-threonylcarbamoyladenylate synthase [Aquihabitans sp. G128]QXC63174.1 threonylcarbamoyl-AMP synthase [Aquihabitans sp. G128]
MAHEDGPEPELVEVGAPDDLALERAAAVLLAGGAVVLPTDTVYGLAALPHVAGATAALFALKDRAESQPMAVLVADAEQALALVADPPEAARRWMAELWPGSLTIVLRRSPAARGLALGGDDETTIGLRCPGHPFVRALARRVGPIATTSANRSGEPTPTSASEAAAALAGPVALVVDGGPAGTVPSTVVDASRDPWRVLRLGGVTDDQLA